MARSLPAGVEVRAANREEMEQLRYINQMVFAEHGHAERDASTWLEPEWTTCVFERGAMATSFAAWPFSMRFNGARAHVAGVTAVGTLPNKRRRGYLRAAMEAALAEQRDRGQSLAILYASQAAIYYRFGYAVTSFAHSFEIDPLDLNLIHHPEPSGEVIIADAADLPDGGQALKDVYREFAEPRNGLLHRGQALWEAEPLAAPAAADGPIRALIYEEDGKALGYMLFTNRDTSREEAIYGYRAASGGQRDQLMHVREYAALTPAAAAALWRTVASHDLVSRVILRAAPADDPLRYLARDPRTLRTRVTDGLLTRVVDVERALQIRPYGAEAALTFAVQDDICDWNARTWRIDASRDGADVQETSAAPQLSMDVYALAQLATGHLSATELASLGRIEAADVRALETADAMFRARYAQFCMNHF